MEVLRLNKTVRPLLVASAFLILGACSSSRTPAVEPRAAAATVFGDELSLTGYTIGSKNDHTEVELRWKALRKPSADYVAFVHALDGADSVAFQGDHWLTNDTGAQTSAWTAGDSVAGEF
jgi:hypothetical protein